MLSEKSGWYKKPAAGGCCWYGLQCLVWEKQPAEYQPNTAGMSYLFDSLINEDQLAYQRGHALHTQEGGILDTMFVLFAKDNTAPIFLAHSIWN